MKSMSLKLFYIFVIGISLFSCNNSNTKVDNKLKDTTANKMDTSTTKGKTLVLFDGKTLNGWHGYNKSGEVKNWMIEDSALVCLGASKDASGGDIVTDDQYENFELSWQWKITKGGNSGIMYHVVESPKYKTTYETGPEYQMIDDIDFPEKLADWQKSGSDYAMNLTNENKRLKPSGEWNTSKILFNNGAVEHWLNGQKIIAFTAWNDEWNKKKKEGKWKDYPDYGSAKKGHIALQDHGNKAYFKNIVLKVL